MGLEKRPHPAKEFDTLCEQGWGRCMLPQSLHPGLHRAILTSIVESCSSAHPPLSLIHSCSAGAAHLDADICNLLGL